MAKLINDGTPDGILRDLKTLQEEERTFNKCSKLADDICFSLREYMKTKGISCSTEFREADVLVAWIDGYKYRIEITEEENE